jgi:hypothetical protein
MDIFICSKKVLNIYYEFTIIRGVLIFMYFVVII